MAVADLIDWMDENTGPNILWYLKRLSGNDTLANGSHQGGPYIPKEVLLDVFPSMNRPEAENPDKWFEVRIDSHSDVRRVRAIWYNSKLRMPETVDGKKVKRRDETRVTNFGGAESALLDPESTGALAVFAFHRGEDRDASICHVWVCDHETQAEIFEERVGPVEPGRWVVWSVDEAEAAQLASSGRTKSSCWLEPSRMPASWVTHFPTGEEIVRRAVQMQRLHSLSVDRRLIRRRKCEYEIFRSVEQAIELPLIQKGFADVEEFIARAQTILQRRKSRSGLSLELHTREIFVEEQLSEGVHFDHQPESEHGKKPDFLFPSAAAYRNPDFPVQRLRMLAAKTTCKDRWRQVISEADRIPTKHLLTLQEGLSEKQFREMTEARVQLVVPEPLLETYPKAVQPHLQTLESFIADIRLLSVGV